MKTLHTLQCLLLTAMIFTAVFVSGQTKHIVNTVSQTFSPETLSIQLGDTVEWTWGGGTPHTTTSDATSGPDVWTADLNATTSTFDFVISMVGNHPYHCNIHGGVGYGMTGLIVVNPTGINELKNKNGSSVFPNPFSKKAYIVIEELHYDRAEIYNNDGRLIQTISPIPAGSNTLLEVSLPDSPPGVYMYAIFKDGQAVETAPLIKN
ncbi:MAG: T9SS type A sorting domain-containing protein [Flavobacteriales bacterium]